MDDTKVYIKQCSMCVDIQKLYDPSKPSFLWDHSLKESYDRSRYTYKEYRILDIVPLADMPLGLHIFTSYDGYEWSCIWLPRQDELQQMVKQESDKNYDWQVQLSQLDSFVTERSVHGESFSDYSCQFETWEQLWLAFVMHERYGRRWNGERWVAG